MKIIACNLTYRPVYIQQKLSDLVSKSFAFRRESKALLERAKAMVEQAIEFSA